MTATTGCPWQPTLSYISHIFGYTLSLILLSNVCLYLEASMVAPLALLSIMVATNSSLSSTMVAAPTAFFDNGSLHMVGAAPAPAAAFVNGQCRPLMIAAH